MRTRLGLAVVLAAFAALVPVSAAGAGAAGSPPSSLASPDPAARMFTFFGSGWGHGVGLSQWGAYGLAVDGWTHQRILTHFYSGATVGSLSQEKTPDLLRVGLTWGDPAL